ncbi:MAG: hypothetical protein WDN28_11145 [Chthoniobacter sp.]
MKPILLILCGAVLLSVLPACENEKRTTTTTTTEETTVAAPATTETHTVRTY